jgi:hypothetical protein
MKKYSSSRGSSALSYFFAFVALIVLALSGLFIANLYLNKPTQLGSQASTNGVIPSETQRESVPAGAIPLNNGVGITNNAMFLKTVLIGFAAATHFKSKTMTKFVE